MAEIAASGGSAGRIGLQSLDWPLPRAEKMQFWILIFIFLSQHFLSSCLDLYVCRFSVRSDVVLASRKKRAFF